MDQVLKDILTAAPLRLWTCMARRFCWLLIAIACGALAAHSYPAATFIVSNTSDSGPGSLRQAILEATNGFDTIAFQIPGSGVQTIAPLSPLPPITVSVIIDGTAQPGFSSRPLIELDGVNAGNNAGLRLLRGSSTVRGLAIKRFSTDDIDLQSPF